VRDSKWQLIAELRLAKVVIGTTIVARPSVGGSGQGGWDSERTEIVRGLNRKQMAAIEGRGISYLYLSAAAQH
jgi:hypothetical protein